MFQAILFLANLWFAGKLVLKRLLLHIHNWLCVQSTRALLCLGVWSRMDYVRDKDVKAAIVLPEVGLDEEDILSDDWDAI